MIIRKIIQAFAGARNIFSGYISPEQRIHADFMYDHDEGWLYNHRMLLASGRSEFRSDSQKIRILLNVEDLHKLDGCPYAGKLGPSIDPQFPLKYCAFLYPEDGVDTIDEMAAWVKARSFPNATIFTYGKRQFTDNPNVRNGQWAPGVRVRGGLGVR